MLATTLVDQGFDVHPMCDKQYLETQRRNQKLRDKLIEIIRYVDETAPRSQQVEIGPSEMGIECDARIGRILAGHKRVNFQMDPWASIVGTSIHRWLEDAVAIYQQEVNDPEVAQWVTEMKVVVDEMISGHTDLWDGEDVIDYKSTGPDVQRKMQQHGPPIEHKVQAHIYGYARTQMGFKVRDVVDVFLPRAGWLKDMYIWREPYDESVAVAAIDRVYAIGALLLELDVLADPHKWADVPRETSKCWYCPFYVDRSSEQGPDETGCPGANGSQEVRNEAAVKSFEKGLIG